MNLSERVAKIVVEAVLPGSRMDFRGSQSVRTHDFDLITPLGTVAALEVTSAADPRILSTEAAILDERKGGSFVPRRETANDWYICPTVDANIHRVRKLADRYLADIEKEGLREFQGEGSAFSSLAVARIWEDLRVEAGWVASWNPPGFIALALPGDGGWLNPHHVYEAVRVEAEKPDNREKLARSGASERHLFVYVDPSNALPWMCFREMRSGQLPSLPAEITYVWACAPYDHTVAVLHGSVSLGRWERLSVPCVAGAV
jgi:hypothetical protein